MKKYIAKPHTWFKEGTEATILPDDDFGEMGGIYEGIYIVGTCVDDTGAIYDPYAGYNKFWIDKGYKIGDEVIMRELCGHDEFDVIEEEE